MARCTGCPSEKIFCRGLCRACYHRLRRNGTVERKNVIRAGHCIVEGCTSPVFAKNLCPLHYSRAQHPLMATWKLLRSRHACLYPAAWDRFDAFIADVGERPSPSHKFKRLDATMPFSKENFWWAPPLAYDPNNSRKGYHASYGREWNMQKRFGISGEDYGEMLKAQDGKCAICLEKEHRPDRRNAGIKALAVDHNHATGDVRGLLCADCNTALGLLDDSIPLLRAAITYLERHATASVKTAQQRGRLFVANP